MMPTFTPLGVGREKSCSRSGCRAGHRGKIGGSRVNFGLPALSEHSRSTADDRLPDTSLRRVEGDDRVIEGRRAVAGAVPGRVTLRIACTEDSEQGGDEGKYSVPEGDLR